MIELQITPKTFENFINSDATELAFNCCSSIMKNNYKTLYIHSQSSLGKTHLAHATYSNLKTTSPELKVVFTNTFDLMKEMISYMKDNRIIDFYENYIHLDVLIIDDFHDMKSRNGTQDYFLRIMDEILNNNKKIILFSKDSIKNLEGVNSHLLSRLSAFVAIELHHPSIKTRYQITKRKALEFNIQLSDDEIKWPAYLCENSREIEGMLLKIKTCDLQKNT